MKVFRGFLTQQQPTISKEWKPRTDALFFVGLLKVPSIFYDEGCGACTGAGHVELSVHKSCMKSWHGAKQRIFMANSFVRRRPWQAIPRALAWDLFGAPC